MKIALTYTGNEVKHQNYVRWLKAGDAIDIVTISAALDNLSVLEDCSGIVMSGGIDVYPKVYNNPRLDYPHSPVDFNEERDKFEILAYRFAQERNLPVLGVCRGLQLINCIHSGNLRQDLGVTLNEVHKSALEDKAHGINITTGSLLHQITGTERAVVNSAHHQAVMEIGKGLKVTARADDDTIEALEREHTHQQPFFLCIQWHPERMFKFGLNESPLAMGIRNRFTQSAQSFK